MFDRRSYFITGAAGTIGRLISEQFVEFNYKELVLLDFDETRLLSLVNDLKLKKSTTKITYFIGDLYDSDFLNFIFSQSKIDVVIHTAAYKHVVVEESNVYSFVKNNITVTQKLFEESIKNNIPDFIFISTDKAVYPKSIIGYTKLISELYLKYQGAESNVTDVKILRFGNVMGSRGSAVEKFIKRLDSNLPIEVTDLDSQRFYISPITIIEQIKKSLEIKMSGGVLICNELERKTLNDVIDEVKSIYKINQIDIKLVGLNKYEKKQEDLFFKFEEPIVLNEGEFSSIKNYPISNSILSKIEKLTKNIFTYDSSDVFKILEEITHDYINLFEC